MLCKNVFLRHFSIMVQRLFDDQNFIVLFNLFSMFEKSLKYAKDLFTCFVDLKRCMIAFATLEISAREWR